jgi:hypothetical protein
MWINVGNSPQNEALSYHQYFYPNQVKLSVQSIKYWVPGNCTEPQTVTRSDLYNYSLEYNAFTGTDVIIDGTNGAINIPQMRNPPNTENDRPPCATWGNLEAIAINYIQIKGAFADSGYLVLKADPNMCGEYTGPYPSNDILYNNGIHKKKSSGNDSTKNIKIDTLKINIKNISKNTIYSLQLTNVPDEEQNSIAFMSLYNMLGQLLLSRNIILTAGNSFYLNLSNYPNGVYMAVIRTNNEIITKKIIREK